MADTKIGDTITDDRKPVLAPRDLGWNIEFRLVLPGVIGRFRFCQQRIDLFFEFQLGLLHPLVAHRLVARRIGLDLRAVNGNRPELDQSAFLRQLHHLHKQVRQFLQVKGAKVAKRAMRRIVARREDPERDIFMQLPGQLARREHAGRIAVHEHLHHHRRMKGLIARTAACIPRMEG